MSGMYHLTPVRVARGTITKLLDLPRLGAPDVQDFVDVIERSIGKELRGLAWTQEVFDPEDPDADASDASDFCVKPKAVRAALTLFDRHYARHPDKYPSFFNVSAFEVATGKPYWPAITVSLDGAPHRLSVGEGQCVLLPLTQGSRPDRRRRQVEPGEYEWESITTVPTRVRLKVTKQSMLEVFGPLLAQLRTVTEAAEKANARLYPEVTV